MQGYSRRALLASAGALSTGALAGCLGGDGGGSGSERECSGEQRSVEVPPAGDPESGVTLAVYEDFACPGCGEFSLNVLPGIKTDYVEPGRVAYEHHDLPIPVDEEWSWRVANASLAVFEDAGAGAYYAFVEEVFQYQGEYSEGTVAGLAAELGADEEAVRAAMEEEPFCERLNESRAEATERGVEVTPTVFVNDQQLEAPGDEELREAIDAELA
ncbi:thioredoxin domain-containing protein [Halalkalicoccus sp. NIPERK01]|uniref:DsbA family protein n=1 Tax=Halalkalicoccus sp. NIPERK01 TaxID=3053469 RepID=UPI00256E9CAE|nr:thioredoxin domain-containing protein [Halalkalicoccus sp. NIPERK01]MDL5362273.1 thioredoxin domain-containing protein [Halalkalicoccus sp. NIPERK01]